MTKLEYTEKCLVRQIYTDTHYEVWIVKMEDMLVETYGIINRETGVIENLQPNLFNATALAKQFSKWARGEEEEQVDISMMLRGASDAPLN